MPNSVSLKRLAKSLIVSIPCRPELLFCRLVLCKAFWPTPVCLCRSKAGHTFCVEFWTVIFIFHFLLLVQNRNTARDVSVLPPLRVAGNFARPRVATVFLALAGHSTQRVLCASRVLKPWAACLSLLIVFWPGYRKSPRRIRLHAGSPSTYVGSVFQVARNTDPLAAPSIRRCSAFVCGMG